MEDICVDEAFKVLIWFVCLCSIFRIRFPILLICLFKYFALPFHFALICFFIVLINQFVLLSQTASSFKRGNSFSHFIFTIIFYNILKPLVYIYIYVKSVKKGLNVSKDICLAAQSKRTNSWRSRWQKMQKVVRFKSRFILYFCSQRNGIFCLATITFLD